MWLQAIFFLRKKKHIFLGTPNEITIKRNFRKFSWDNIFGAILK
jgi:hypothetical protein